MMARWTSAYKNKMGIDITYASRGSGVGVAQMIARTYDFGCSDAPLSESQMARAMQEGGEVVHIPLALGAVVPTYNLPGVDKPVRFTGEVLADIFLGNIKQWNDPKLQALQEEGVKLPDLEITVVHRSDGSGTTYIFAEYLAKFSPAWKQSVGVSTYLYWPAGVGQRGNGGVARLVKRLPGAIGYNELNYALEHNLRYGAVKNREGHYILGSLDSVTAAADASLKEIPEDLRYSLTNAPGPESYPIAGTNWAVLYVSQPANRAETIKDFLRWATHEGQELCTSLHYARLPQSLIRRLEKKLALLGKG
jgi:phosphate transport system substrate-binding protein